MADTIKTYPQLGRFIMNEVYNILLNAKDYKIDYKELKRRIKEKIDNNPQIDKEFANHILQHGSSKSYLCTYRWENVLYYYLMQSHKPAFTHFEYWEDKKGVHDYIALRSDYLLNPEHRYFNDFRMLQETGKFTVKKTGKKAKEITSMFDWAQYLNKGVEEKYLRLIRTYPHLVDNDTFREWLESQDLKLGKLQKIKAYYSNLENDGPMAEWYLTQEESILHNRKNIKTRGGN